MGEEGGYFRRWEFFGSTFPRHPPREADVKNLRGSVGYSVLYRVSRERTSEASETVDAKCIVLLSVSLCLGHNNWGGKGS